MADTELRQYVKERRELHGKLIAAWRALSDVMDFEIPNNLQCFESHDLERVTRGVLETATGVESELLAKLADYGAECLGVSDEANHRS